MKTLACGCARIARGRSRRRAMRAGHHHRPGPQGRRHDCRDRARDRWLGAARHAQGHRDSCEPRAHGSRRRPVSTAATPIKVPRRPLRSLRSSCATERSLRKVPQETRRQQWRPRSGRNFEMHRARRSRVRWSDSSERQIAGAATDPPPDDGSVSPTMSLPVLRRRTPAPRARCRAARRLELGRRHRHRHALAAGRGNLRHSARSRS